MWMMVEGETLEIKLFSGYTWYTFIIKHKKLSIYMYRQFFVFFCETHTKYNPRKVLLFFSCAQDCVKLIFSLFLTILEQLKSSLKKWI